MPHPCSIPARKRHVSSWAWSLAFLLTVLFGVIPRASATDVQTKTAVCEGTQFRYLLLVPEKESALPALLLLHGSGDSPWPMVDAWRQQAKKNKIILIAPELPLRRDFETAAPLVFKCVVEDAKRFATVEAKRVYVFGNSMGGYLAYDAAAFDSEYFAAVAVHAMGIDPDYDGILDAATRKTPIAIYMGERDPLVSLKNVRRTRELLQSKGFSVHYVELKDHDHNYYGVAERINPDIWDFLSGKSLP
ncbi:MAG TPA: alpha/beta fold hydrolase [Candidatus Dormibacteraeota bacterium]|nr:alpha/beta fold hydrolase [Candidatus Dormibacteraeota bacterium]